MLCVSLVGAVALRGSAEHVAVAEAELSHLVVDEQARPGLFHRGRRLAPAPSFSSADPLNSPVARRRAALPRLPDLPLRIFLPPFLPHRTDHSHTRGHAHRLADGPR